MRDCLLMMQGGAGAHACRVWIKECRDESRHGTQECVRHARRYFGIGGDRSRWNMYEISIGMLSMD